MLKRTIKWLMVNLGIDLYLKTPDRALLEGTILPWLSVRPSTSRVLFIGCDWYTHGYRQWFPRDTYWTLDYDPAKKLFGSPRLHITDSMANLAAHFEPGSLDLVICNGVFGWGLNAPRDIEAAFRAVHLSLRAGGLLLFGWNNTPERCPMPVANIAALQQFRSELIGPLGVSQVLTDSPNRHTYSLFVKP